MFIKLFIFIFVGISFLYSVKFNPNTHTLLEELNVDKSFLNDSRVIEARNKLKNYKLKTYVDKLENNIYASIVKKIVQEHTVPNVFYYMAMVESNFNIGYVSSTKAAGIWQFMPLTAKLFDLKINEYVDERRDAVKSSHAAMKFLTSMHNRFEKWYLAAMAYNCGEGRLSRAIREAQSDSLVDLMNEEAGYIPGETRRYIIKIIALASVINVDEILMKNKWYLEYVDVWLNKIKIKANLHINDILYELKINKKDFYTYNRHLNNKKTIPPFKYHIYIPKGKIHLAKTLNNLPRRNEIKTYTVRSGDTLYKISDVFDLKMEELKTINKLQSNILSIGQKLKVMKDKFVVYIVKNGDTLSAIARNHKVKVKTIIDSNKLRTNLIRPKDKLKIPIKDS